MTEGKNKLKDLANTVGVAVPRILALQQKFRLPVCGSYTSGYAVLIKKLVYLSTCSVPQSMIETLLLREKKLLEMLKVDSLDVSPAWFENICSLKSGPTRTLLSGYDLGKIPGAQPGLDFRQRPVELFSNKEMGADLTRALHLYLNAKKIVCERLNQEIPLLSESLKWCRLTASTANSS